MPTKVCDTEHKDLCENCGKPTERKCPVHLKCRCSTKSKITMKELIVGYRFNSTLVNGVYQHPFTGGTEGSVLTLEIPISGPIYKYKEKGKWVVKCAGCLEFKSSNIEHSWLIKWAYSHRCTKRIDIIG